jgi:hypothetical protein
MSADNGTQTDNYEAVFQPVFDFWKSCFEQGAGQFQGWLSGAREASDPQALRRRWLEALGQSLDRYMRTPAFLEAMRRNLEMTTQVKSTVEDWARDLSRSTGIPRLSDISGLFARLQIGQEAILARLGAIEQRLEALENKRKRTDH